MSSSSITDEIVLESVAKQFGADPNHVKIVSCEKSPGAAFGEGFACEMWKLDIKALVNGEEKNDISYIAKALPEGDFREGMIKKVVPRFCQQSDGPLVQTIRSSNYTKYFL